MKRYIITCMAALMGVLYSQAESISIGDVSMAKGETTTIAISLTNSHTDLVSFQMDLYLPDGITINKSGSSLSNRFESGQTLTIGKQADGAYRLTSTSFSLTPITGTSGTIISLSLTASNEIGAKSASIKNIMFATSSSDRITLNNISFGVTIRGEQSVSITSLPSLTYGDAYTLPSKTDQEQELTWTVNNNDVASISGNVITTKGAGSTTVTATQAGTNIFYPLTKTYTLDVNKASLSAKVNDATKIYGSANPSFSIEYNGLKNGETVPAWTTQPTIQTEATQTSGVGQYAIKAINGVASNYDLEIDDGTLNITPASLTIKAKDATRLYNEDDPTFEYACSGFVNNDDVQVLTKLPDLTADATKTSNVGKYVITPSGAEAKNYIISYEQGELTITKRTLKATSNATRMYGEDNPLLSIEYDGFVNNDTEAVLLKKPVGTSTATKTSSVGVYPITVSGGEATNYDFVYEQGTLTVEKASLSAKVNDATKVYGSVNPSFSIEYDGLRNGETVPAWTTQPTIQTEATQTSGVGLYAIKAVNGVAQNYDLKVTDGTLSITPATLTIKANDATRLYNEDDPAFEFACSGFLNNDDVQVLTKLPDLTADATKTSNVGKYKITPSGAEAKNYEISYEQGELTITKRTLKATSNATRMYGEDNPLLTIEYDGFVNNDTEAVLSKKPVGTSTATRTSSVGVYPITVSGGEATNYDFVYEQGTLTVEKASLSAKVNDATKVYGSVNPTFSIEYDGLRNGETVPAWTTQPTIQTEATQASGVGQYAIKAINGVATNYNLEIDDGTLSITPAALTIKAKDATRLYFDDNPAFEFTCSGFVNNDDVQALTKLPDLTADATKTSNVGKYIISPSGAEAKNYVISYEQGELTITKRNLKATSNATRMYGEDNPLLTIEYDGFVNNDTEAVLLKKPVGTSTATRTSSVGVYPITVSGGEATNYDFVYEQGTLTVEKASLSAKVNDATKVYGSANPSFSIEYNGLKNGETVPAWTTQPTIQTEATQTSGVGQYAIKAINGVATNYNLEIDDGTLSITPAALTIKANDAVRQYYNDDPSFSYTCNGFVNGEDESVLTEKPTLSTSAKLTSNVGTYEIKVGETSSPNYSISKVNGTLTITPRTLLAFVGNYERKYNEDNPEFEVKYDGFVGNDGESVLSAKAIASTTATKTSDVGTYPINVTGGSAENYTFNYTSGTLTINKAEQTISWQQNLTGLKVTDQVELKAEASSGLPITYTIDNGSSIADIYSTGDKIYLDCISAGELQIIAVQPGNNNYYSTPRIRKNVIINNTSNIRGDVNDDGVVNGTDIQAIINLIVESQYDEKGDVNEDGTVNGTDIQEVINIIVNEE